MKDQCKGCKQNTQNNFKVNFWCFRIKFFETSKIIYGRGWWGMDNDEYKDLKTVTQKINKGHWLCNDCFDTISNNHNRFLDCGDSMVIDEK
jgi:hypothetical protein